MHLATLDPFVRKESDRGYNGIVFFASGVTHKVEPVRQREGHLECGRFTVTFWIRKPTLGGDGVRGRRSDRRARASNVSRSGAMIVPCFSSHRRVRPA